MIEFNFIIGTLEDTYDQVTKWLGNRPRNNVMYFDDFTGKGCLLITELEKGFFIRTWDYTVNEDTRFRISAVDNNYPVMFMINYLLTPGTYWVEKGIGGPGPGKKISKLNNVIFSSNQTEFAFNVRGGHQARALDICFTYEWLLQQYPAKNKDNAISVISLHGEQQPVFFESFSIDDYRMISEIMEKVSKNEWDIIFLKSRALTLMDEVLKNIFNKKSGEHGRAPVHADLMIEVEKKLSSILHEKLPNLKAIAKEFSLSESTLKRQFKQVYGKAIYEYYLYKKMELAKRMLLEKDITISQVAYSLGYEKASPFIRVFKKQFGVSPGSLRASHNTNDVSLSNNVPGNGDD